MTFKIKCGDEVIATLTGERIKFGTRQERDGWVGARTVEDKNILKALDLGGNALFVVLISHRNVTVEAVE
ncbi:MAG: hypothetical protein WBA09_22495 [Candidatus Acidiferrum sp.]